MSERQWYEEYQEELNTQAQGKDRTTVTNDLQEVHEFVFDPMTAVKQEHHWVDRGLKVSCEGAGHPHHQAWKRKPMY